MEKKLYGGINLFKYFCAFLVIAIHTQPFTEISYSLGYFFTDVLPRIAVPFFFIAYGYFNNIGLNNAEDKKQYYIKSTKRLIIFYAIWSVIYFPVDFILPILKAGFSIKMLIHYIINLLFFGSHFHLWFMPALIISSIFGWLMKSNPKKLLILSLFLYLIGLLGCSYSFIGKHIFGLSFFINSNIYYEAIFTPIRRIFFMGLPFYAIGYYLPTVKYTWTKRESIYMTLASIFVFLIEIYSLKIFNESMNVIITIGLIPLTACAFILFKKIYSTIQNSKELSQYSTGIYFVHPLFILLITVIAKIIRHNISPTIIFILTSVLSIIFVYSLLRINHRLLNKLIL